jgi:hypothetical protein
MGMAPLQSDWRGPNRYGYYRGKRIPSALIDKTVFLQAVGPGCCRVKPLDQLIFAGRIR